MRDSDGWLGLELRHLMALKTVAEEKTFAGAAVRLGYTQSAVSQQIAALERIVGERLIERPPGRRPVGLTEPGELLLRHGEAILARIRAVQADLAAVSNGSAGTLRVGTYQSVGLHILPLLLPGFNREWPRLEVQLRESASDYELLEMVECGELDLTFCMLPPSEGPFETLELLADPYVLVVPRDSPLADKRQLQVGDIAGLPLIGFRSCRNDHRIETQLRGRGLEPSIVFRSDDNPTVQALVAAGVGAALMPRLAVDLDDDRSRWVDVGDLFPPRLLGLVWHRDRTPGEAFSAFIAMAEATCSSILAQPSAT